MNQLVLSMMFKKLCMALFCLILLTILGGVMRTFGGPVSDHRREAAQIDGHILEQEAIIRVYGARTWGWRKIFAVHTWIAIKPAGASEFLIYEVIGWRHYRGLNSIRRSSRVADAPWFGQPAKLIFEQRGDIAAEVADSIDEVIKHYPYQDRYRAWPGPNSNTFIAWLGQQYPRLALDLPSTAIGKDYRAFPTLLSSSASGGMHLGLVGLFALSLGVSEGIEISILGLNIEFDLFDAAIEIPGAGRIGN